MSDTWFTNLEAIVHSVVEYIPLVGTVYSFKRATIAHSEHDRKHFWMSLANFAEGAVRDVILVKDFVEPKTVVIIHTMVEAFTDELINIYTSNTKPFRVHSAIDKNEDYVIVAGESTEQSQRVAAELFQGKAKGLHHFHQSVFTGTLIRPPYAPNGEKIWLHLPEGLYDGAKCSFMWKWTEDYWKKPNRPDYTYGRIKLHSGNPTSFSLEKKTGYYNFSGEIYSKNHIRVSMTAGNSKVSIEMVREPQNASV